MVTTAQDDASPQRILVVEPPAFAPGPDESTVGSIQEFAVLDASTRGSRNLQKVFPVYGTSKLKQFGSGLAALKDGLLAVGSVSKSLGDGAWQAGVLRAVDISLIKNGTDSKLSDLMSIVTMGSPLSGSQKAAQLLSAFMVSSGGMNEQCLWILEPCYLVGIIEGSASIAKSIREVVLVPRSFPQMRMGMASRIW